MSKLMFASIMALGAFSLAACVSGDGTQVPVGNAVDPGGKGRFQETAQQGIAPPTNAERQAIALDAYQSAFGKAPKNLRIGPLQTRNVVGMISEQKDFVFCTSWTEIEQTGPVYTGSGKLIRGIGDPYTEHGAVLARKQNGAWIPALFKWRGQSFGNTDVIAMCGSD